MNQDANTFVKAGLAVLGNISFGGVVERVINFADKITMLSDNGAKTVVVLSKT